MNNIHNHCGCTIQAPHSHLVAGHSCDCEKGGGGAMITLLAQQEGMTHLPPWEVEFDKKFTYTIDRGMFMGHKNLDVVPEKATTENIKDFIRSLLASQRETLAVGIMKFKLKGAVPHPENQKYHYQEGYNEALGDAAAHIRKQ